MALEEWEDSLLEPARGEADRRHEPGRDCLACLDDYDAHACRPIDGDLIELQFADPRFR